MKILYTDKGHYPTVRRQLKEFLYILKEYVENNSFVKYYERIVNFNKVIKGLNIKSAVSLQWTGMETNGKRNRDNALNGTSILQSNALSRITLDCVSHWSPLQTYCKILYLKPL